MSTMDIEHVRDRNPIEDIVAEKFQLKKTGNHYIGLEHDSLVVNPRTGWYHWNSRDERGDVFDFTGRYLIGNGSSWNSRDPGQFVEAIHFLAKRAGIPIDREKMQQSPAWNERQLLQRLNDALVRNQTALAYVRGRGWDDRTIRAEMIGYMPNHKGSILKGLKLASKWADVVRKLPPGMIVYGHRERGRLTYLSGRSIEEKRHYNPPRDIVGERQPYLNHLYSPTVEEVVLVEGQADAITLAQWGIAAIAINGLHLNDRFMLQLRQHQQVYVMLDNTPDAQQRGLEIARELGPIACIPALPAAVKDANEWLVKQQPTTAQITACLNQARTLVEVEVDSMVGMVGLAQQKKIRELVTRAANWNELETATLRHLLKEKIGLSMSLFNGILKSVQADHDDDEPDTQLLPDNIPLISPALGFRDDLAMVTVSLLERTSKNRINIQPYMVTSDRELVRLGKAQIITINGQETALRTVPEGTEFLIRWRHSDIRRFLEGEVVEPSDVYRAVHGLFTKHVDFRRPTDAVLVSLWVIGTYFYTMFNAYPYLALNGPKNSGKSTVLTVAKPLAFNMITTSDITGPSLFRLIHNNCCSVGIDEAERYYNPRDTELQQIRQLLNSGYKPGMPAIRLTGEEHKPQAFQVYSPKMLANIAGLEDVLASRCIPISMRRTDRKIPALPIGFDGESLRHQLYALMLNYHRAVQQNYAARPELHQLQNRSNELWSPLVALAAFFEEQGEVAGLLQTVTQAAQADYHLSEGKALSDQEEAVLQALELLTRNAKNDVAWIKAVDLREQVANLMTVPVEKFGSAQWIGHVMKRLQLTDRARKRAYSGGQMYAIARDEVQEMMRRYDVPKVDVE